MSPFPSLPKRSRCRGKTSLHLLTSRRSLSALEAVQRTITQQYIGLLKKTTQVIENVSLWHGHIEMWMAGQRIGALDLGGSSLEVTFPSLHKTSEELEIAGEIRNGSCDRPDRQRHAGVHYWLESKTFDHLGLNSAFERSVWLLAREANQTGSSMSISLHHPCMFDGYNATVVVHPPKDFPDVDVSFPSIHAELIGAPSWSQCEKLVQEVDSSCRCLDVIIGRFR